MYTLFTVGIFNFGLAETFGGQIFYETNIKNPNSRIR